MSISVTKCLKHPPIYAFTVKTSVYKLDDRIASIEIKPWGLLTIAITWITSHRLLAAATLPPALQPDVIHQSGGCSLLWPKVSKNFWKCSLDCPKSALSSQIKNFTLGTNFSHSLGQKQYKKLKIEFFRPFFQPAQAIQSFTT